MNSAIQGRIRFTAERCMVLRGLAETCPTSQPTDMGLTEKIKITPIACQTHNVGPGHKRSERDQMFVDFSFICWNIIHTLPKPGYWLLLNSVTYCRLPSVSLLCITVTEHVVEMLKMGLCVCRAGKSIPWVDYWVKSPTGPVRWIIITQRKSIMLARNKYGESRNGCDDMTLTIDWTWSGWVQSLEMSCEPSSSLLSKMIF